MLVSSLPAGDDDPTFRAAFEELMTSTGRTHVIIARVAAGACTAVPTLAMLHDGYQVLPLIDACGAWNPYEADAALTSMVRAGAEPSGRNPRASRGTRRAARGRSSCAG